MEPPPPEMPSFQKRQEPQQQRRGIHLSFSFMHFFPHRYLLHCVGGGGGGWGNRRKASWRDRNSSNSGWEAHSDRQVFFPGHKPKRGRRY